MDVYNNNIQGNGMHGIMYEICATGRIVNNLVTNNGGIGIYNANTNAVEIWNNTVVGSKIADIELMQEYRQPDNFIRGRDPGRTFPDQNMTWYITTGSIVNNVVQPKFDASEASVVLKCDNKAIAGLNRDGASFGQTINGNFYNQTTAGQPTSLFRWPRASGAELITSFPAWQTGTKSDSTGSIVVGVNALTPTFSVASTHATAANAGAVPLPADLADLVGLPAGTKAVGCQR